MVNFNKNFVWCWFIAVVDISEILNNSKIDYLQKVDSFITYFSNLSNG